MKLIHLSDLHLGKKIKENSLQEDHVYILKQIIEIIQSEKPDAVLIAGDVYDRSLPSVEAVTLFDDFITKLSLLKIPVMIISGNHDSAERLTFASRLLKNNQIYISRKYDGNAECVVLNDEYGKVNFYFLPFIKPAVVQQFYPDEKIETYTDAVSLAINKMNIDKSSRNVLLAHQFVTGAQRSDSEELSVGGLDNVDSRVFNDFDYVALGHLHGPQTAGSERIRYSGSPLKFSFSEVNQKKGVLIVELDKDGFKECRTIPLVPLRDMIKIKGKYDELLLKKNYESLNLEDFIHITLTDEDEIPDAFYKLRTIYKNLLTLEYDNLRTKNNSTISFTEEIKALSPLERFDRLYEMQNNCPMNDEQKSFLEKLIEEIWEAE
ncbi:MAG: exonuclease SbcCD subunit D [Treponema sp.]|nr:exonuclease SbcCD subunit D [Treponema sp.]